METVEAGAVVGGMAFTVRAWRSVAAGAWFWTAVAEDHPYARSGARPWPSARLATEAALAHLARLAGEGA